MIKLNEHSDELSNKYERIDNYIYYPYRDFLGKGSYSEVYKAYDETKNLMEVAVKIISLEKLLQNKDEYRLILREIDILSQIRGKNIVNLLNIKRTHQNLYVFTDYCNGGDLEDYLKNNGPLSERESLSIIKQISNAFISFEIFVKNTLGQKFCIIHRDIKPANILFHETEVKIADFGFAKVLEEDIKHVKMNHTRLGTPLYMNPQTLAGEIYSYKCDIWSAGVILYECLFKKLPWTGSSISNLFFNIQNIFLEFPKFISEETKNLIINMLQFNEESRIDWNGIYNHNALHEIFIPDRNKEACNQIEIHTESQNTFNIISSPSDYPFKPHQNSPNRLCIINENIMSDETHQDLEEEIHYNNNLFIKSGILDSNIWDNSLHNKVSNDAQNNQSVVNNISYLQFRNEDVRDPEFSTKEDESNDTIYYPIYE